MPQYRDGTVHLTNGVTTITGVSTSFVSNVSAGYCFKADDYDVVYGINSIASTSKLYLVANYGGSSVSNADYQITTDFTTNLGLAEVWAGDRDWPYHLTASTLRPIDAHLHRRVIHTTSGTTITSGTTTIGGTSSYFTAANLGLATITEIVGNCSGTTLVNFWMQFNASAGVTVWQANHKGTPKLTGSSMTYIAVGT